MVAISRTASGAEMAVITSVVTITVGDGLAGVVVGNTLILI